MARGVDWEYGGHVRGECGHDGCDVHFLCAQWVLDESGGYHRKHPTTHKMAQ